MSNHETEPALPTTRRKRTRANGDGSVFRQRPNGPWWISYKGPDGTRKQESTGSKSEEYARRLLRKRLGAREHNLPVITNAEKLTFADAGRAWLAAFALQEKNKSLKVVQRRFDKHLLPYFGTRKLAGITRDDVIAYIRHRQQQGIVNRHGERRNDVSNAEINRELQHLKRIFNFTIQGGRLGSRPYIPMLQEAKPRSGFFERAQFTSVLKHLPAELRPVMTFAYITGWRVNSEVLPLEWHRVDFAAGEVRLAKGTTKNGEGRVFPMTAELRALLEAQKAAHEQLQQSGHVVPWVWWRMVADGRGGEKKPHPVTSLTKAWKAACRAAGVPGRIPHDLRRTAVRNLVRAGIAQSVAMQMTGHKTDSVFRRYDIVSGQDLHDAARRLDTVAARS
jgi:integrase